jgi:Asp-tRNA(Asn)/Glu-tRNA(Gln) amidotransferase A subunit family amidase
MTPSGGRAQVVLLAAVVVAVALVAMATAYHGLGYRGDTRVATDLGAEDPVTTADRRLQRDVDRAAVGVVRPWAQRTRTVADVRTALDASRRTLQRTGATRRHVYVVSENESVATDWADEDCPGGPMRAFGPCLADGGVVVQERANETVLVGVALDVTVRTAASETTAVLRLRAR